MSALIEIRVLGPVAAVCRNRPVPMGGPKDRALLAQLAMASPRTVSEASVVDGIYGDNPPHRVGKVVQNQVFRLRRAMREATGCADIIVTEPGGYRLAGTAAVVDVHMVEELAARARRAMDTGSYAKASELFDDALDLWRGDPLTDVADLPFAVAAVARLEELRWATLEERFEADLVCGRHHRLVGQLKQAVKEAPLRERLWGQLMVALYRSGRQAEALRTFQELRAHLDDELGLIPGPELAAIERDIAAGLFPAGCSDVIEFDQRPQLPAERHRMLSSIPLFQGLSRSQLARVDSLVEDVDVYPGEELTREGERGSRAFVIVAGEATVTIEGRQVATVGAGELVGEMALIDRSPRVATVTAATPMHLLVLEPRGFGALLGEPSVYEAVLRSVVGRLRQLETEPSDLATSAAP